MITALDHIAIAVPDLDRAIKRFVDDFGLDLEEIIDVRTAKTSTAFFPVTKSSIELIHPLTEDSPVQKFLDKRGGGIHHICFQSDNLDADVERLKEKGYKFLSDSPTAGAHEARVMFIHPKCCDGVLIELNERNAKGA